MVFALSLKSQGADDPDAKIRRDARQVSGADAGSCGACDRGVLQTTCQAKKRKEREVRLKLEWFSKRTKEMELASNGSSNQTEDFEEHDPVIVWATAAMKSMIDHIGRDHRPKQKERGNK